MQVLSSAELDDQVFFARTHAEALMQIFSVRKWSRKNIVHQLQKHCRTVFLRRVNCFLLDFGKLSAILKITSTVFQLAASFLTSRARHNAINTVMPSYLQCLDTFKILWHCAAARKCILHNYCTLPALQHPHIWTES